MKKILVLHTGGTISMSQDDAGHVALNQQNPLIQAAKTLPQDIQMVTETSFNLPSACMTPVEMQQLQQRILKANTEGFAGVVISHGTDTLEETAYFLDLTLPKNIAVVVTGAMRSSNEIGSDGLHNFLTAVQVAATPAAQTMGTLVVLNDEIHEARYVTKTHTTNVATFKSPLFGPAGLFINGQPTFFKVAPVDDHLSIKALLEPVYLIKAYAGMDDQLLKAATTPQTKGIVIEALGSGNLPTKVVPALQAILKADIPLVIVSRCVNGVAQPIYAYNGGGVSLVQMGAVFCQGLNGPKARLKLLVGLSAGKTGQALKDYLQH